MEIMFSKFTFPREHGVVIIWSATMLFGTAFALVEQTRIINLLVAIAYGVFFILNYENVREQIDLRFTIINLTPVLSLGTLIAMLVILSNNCYICYALLLHASIGITWIIFYIINKKRVYIELYLGSMLLTTLFYLIATSSVGNISELGISTIIAFWAIFTGYTFVLISFVAAFRQKTSPYAGLFAWVGLLSVVILALVLHLVQLWYGVLLIEPLGQSIYYAITKQNAKFAGVNIRNFGFKLLYSLSSFTILFVLLLILV